MRVAENRNGVYHFGRHSAGNMVEWFQDDWVTYKTLLDSSVGTGLRVMYLTVLSSCVSQANNALSLLESVTVLLHPICLLSVLLSWAQNLNDALGLRTSFSQSDLGIHSMQQLEWGLRGKRTVYPVCPEIALEISLFQRPLFGDSKIALKNILNNY